MMHPQRKKRLSIILFIIIGVGAATGLALYALRQSINLYYTPSQLFAANMPTHRLIRIGGMVKKGSVHFAAQGIAVNFVITDFSHQVKVIYNGVLPALFREGQGIVVEGQINPQGIVVADQVLAKHEANYMPPGVKTNVHS